MDPLAGSTGRTYDGQLVRRSILLAVLAAALAVPSPASAAPIRECGNFDFGTGRWTYGQVRGAGHFNLTTRRVWCTVARQVAMRAYNTYEGGRRWRWRGWRCRIVSRRHEFSDARCKKRRVHVVRWQSGA